MRLFTPGCVTGLLIVLTIAPPVRSDDKADFKLGWGGRRMTVHRVSDATLAALEKVEKKSELKVELTKTCTQADLEKLAAAGWITDIEIAFGNEHIESFEPLAKFKSLRRFVSRTVKKSKAKPFNLAPFSGLKELEEVDFYATRVTNTDALTGHAKLTSVSFYMSHVSSIDFLKTTPNVEALTLYGFGHTFADYAPVLSLGKLKELDIYMNKQATDEKLAPLAKLTTIEEVRMSNSKHVTTLAFLGGSRGLRDLNAAWADKLTDVSALAGCENLSNVDLRDSLIADLNVFKGKAALQWLNVSGTKIKDVKVLATCPKLRDLDISETSVSDLSPLVACKQLSALEMHKTKVTDLSPLKKLPELRRLTVGKSVPKQQIDALKAALPELDVDVRD